jgi:hypothetical protein
MQMILTWFIDSDIKKICRTNNKNCFNTSGAMSISGVVTGLPNTLALLFSVICKKGD